MQPIIWIRNYARCNPVNWAVVAEREALSTNPDWGIVFARAGYLLSFATVAAWLATGARSVPTSARV